MLLVCECLRGSVTLERLQVNIPLPECTLSVEIQVGASFEERTIVFFQGRETNFFSLSATLAV